MKKIIFTLSFLLVGISTMYASNITINTSCGVSVEVEYDDDAEVIDVINDTLILEEVFCSE